MLALELVQGNPGITADRLGDKLGVSERATRRYAGILHRRDRASVLAPP
ncbi:MAG: HTH domain-containing protein [Nocardioidaceae bacterium]|nr:HTH domain-containing protein [Nocardioidaceae bacterium]